MTQHDMGYVNNGMGRWRAVIFLLLYLNDLLNLMKICKKKFFLKKKNPYVSALSIKNPFPPLELDCILKAETKHCVLNGSKKVSGIFLF